MIRNATRACLIAIYLLLLGCNPKLVNQTNTSTTGNCPRIAAENTDTISYIVSFTSQNERYAFTSSFSEFLRNYNFVPVSSDTIRNYFRLQMLPSASDADHTMTITRVQQSDFSEGTITPETSPTIVTQPSEQIDTTTADIGGIVRLYLPRVEIDPPFSSLVSVEPFGDSSNAVLFVTDSSLRKITLKFNGKITNAKKQVLSAIDLISSWTEYTKNHPAEGYALFRHIEGIKEFVAGHEATVRGFGAIDEKTIFLRLAQPDSLALERIKTKRLLQGGLKLGLYYIAKEDNLEITLLPNPSFQQRKPYLDKITLRRGEDSNPILSYSLNKFDALILNATSDLEYARRQFAKNSSFQELSGERYFLSLASTDNNFRNYLKNMIQRADLLRNVARAEGELINAITSDSLKITLPQQEKGAFLGSTQYRILYRKDDPVSKSIAQKLQADLTLSKISCTIIAANAIDYERNLILKNYDCAVGWAPQTVLSDKSEQLRLASIWFDDQTDEQKLIMEAREIPLFKIKQTLVTRNSIEFHQKKIEGIFIRKEQTSPQAN